MSLYHDAIHQTRAIKTDTLICRFKSKKPSKERPTKPLPTHLLVASESSTQHTYASPPSFGGSDAYPGSMGVSPSVQRAVNAQLRAGAPCAKSKQRACSKPPHSTQPPRPGPSLCSKPAAGKPPRASPRARALALRVGVVKGLDEVWHILVEHSVHRSHNLVGQLGERAVWGRGGRGGVGWGPRG